MLVFKKIRCGKWNILELFEENGTNEKKFDTDITNNPHFL